jgi:tRNA G18 (ribose-2'-O)-methylase SpoU
VLSVPFARAERWPSFLADATAAGWTVAALTPGGDTPVHDLDGIDRVCVLLGAEGAGLSDDALRAAHCRVAIPMAPGVDSVNVAAAAAVAFHHRFRP